MDFIGNYNNKRKSQYKCSLTYKKNSICGKEEKSCQLHFNTSKEKWKEGYRELKRKV